MARISLESPWRVEYDGRITHGTGHGQFLETRDVVRGTEQGMLLETRDAATQITKAETLLENRWAQ